MEQIPDVSDRVPRHGDVDWRTEPDGRIAIEKRKYGPVAARFLALFKVSPTMTVRLDAIGSTAWQCMDGRSVGQILEALRETHPDETGLADRLGEYLSTLVSNELVRLD